MSSSAPTSRRWFQFTLRAMAILLLLCAVAAWLWRTYVQGFDEQRRTADVIQRAGGGYELAPSGPDWMRRMIGEGKMRDVVHVDLGDVDFDESLWRRVAALPRLRTLIAGGPQLADEHLARLHRLRELRGLILDSTSVSDAALRELRSALPNLIAARSQRRSIAAIRRLLAKVDLAPFGPAHRAMRPALKQLFGGLYNVHFRDSATAPSDANAVLVYLADLSRRRWRTSAAPLTDAQLLPLRGLHNLRTLTLSAPQVTDAGIRHLRGLKQLRRLDLWETRLTDDGVAHLAGLTNLEYLDLHAAQTSDKGLVHLRGLTKLEFLKLWGDGVTSAGVQQVQQWLPGASVHWHGK